MSRKVLVMDDDRMIAQLTALWLRDAGFDTELASDGASGLAAAAARTPDALVLDIRMPRLDGFEVMRAMRADPALRRVPVVVLSANVQETTRRRALEAGAVRFLSKPFEPRDLVEAVTRATGAQAPGPATRVA